MINQYLVEKTIGIGSFAVVKLCTDSVTGLKYAVKQMNKKMLMTKQLYGKINAYDSVIEELKVLKTLNHPNVIWLNEVIDDPMKDKLYVVTEWLTNGSLADLMAKKNAQRIDKKVGLPLT